MSSLASLRCDAIHQASHSEALQTQGTFCLNDTDDDVPIPSKRNVFGSLRCVNDPEQSYHSTSAGLIPSVAECAVHLALLEAISMLRQKVMKSNALARLFWNGNQSKLATTSVWSFFVELAIIRFAVWFDSLGQVLKTNSQLDVSTLPPIDVLMIWLTFTLNPHAYQQAVKRHSLQTLDKLEMPWSAIHQVFVSNSGRYILPDATSHYFRQVTGLLPNLLDFLIDTQCLSPVEQELTLDKLQLQKAGVKAVDFYLRFETVDKPQESSCEMTGELIDKNSPLSQLLDCARDAEQGGAERILARLRTFGRPWPNPRHNPCALRQTKATRGDLLEVICIASQKDKSLNILTFGELGDRLGSEIVALCQAKSLSSIKQRRLIHSIQWLILAYARLYRVSKELIGSIMRQGSFVSLMDHLRILRSPAALSTLERGLLRFDRFMSLIELKPGVILAPTPDIDLVWHTMQACPWRYRQYCRSKHSTAGLIRHDDGIGQVQIDDGKTRAAELYEIMFREKYQVCLCWDCEALREAVETSPKNTIAITEIKTMANLVKKTVKAYRAAEVSRRNELWAVDLGNSGS